MKNLNLSWYIFYGTLLNMGRQDVLNCRYGEFRDLMSCLAIYNGSAEQVNKKTPRTFEEVIMMD